MRQYTTVQGDTWDGIAYKLYGSEYRMIALMDANTACIDVAVFSAGVALNVPELETPVPATLPPWKRK